ncbi:MAG: YoaP domain-containing protein [Treponema sp.]
MKIITLTPENIGQEHICCAIANTDDIQAASKKEWLSARMEDGLVFKKGDVRGKCFIEYIPAERAWAPIAAAGYMYIDCLWVSGQYKGQGWSTLLLDECISDSRAKGKKGLVVLSSRKKKLPFLSDPSYLKYKGFLEADTAEPYFTLMYLPFDAAAEKPCFLQQAKNPCIKEKGLVVYYTNQCPFTAKYVPLLEQAAEKNGTHLTAHRFENTAQAQQSPSPFTTFSLFYDGSFVTHEIQSEKKFEGIIAGLKR